MTFALRQATASQEVPLGYFVDSTDGDTGETGLTIANTDIQIWKTGATTLANKNSGGATHVAGGVYYAVLDATDTDTIGPLVIFVHVTGALPVRLECVVYDEAVYDWLFGTTAPTTATANAIADALLGRTDGIETGYTPKQALRLILAAVAGKLSGVGTGTVTMRSADDSANRIVATVSSGNRTGVTHTA